MHTFHSFHSKILSGALLALALSCSASQASVLPVNTYSMNNGDGTMVAGTFNYLDGTYSGGNGLTPNASLSGGKGLLTDGVYGGGNWSVLPDQYVGWKYTDPTITFNLAGTPLVGGVDLYVSGGNGGLVGLPSKVTVNGTEVAFTTTDFGFGLDKISVLFGSNILSNLFTVQLFAGGPLADLIDYPFPNDPFLIDPRTGVKTVVEPWLMVSEVQFLSAVPEPSTWIMMILGFGALAFVSFRKSQKALKLAPV